MFNIGEIFKINIVMTVTTKTVKKVDQTLSCVELVLKFVWNLSGAIDTIESTESETYKYM